MLEDMVQNMKLRKSFFLISTLAPIFSLLLSAEALHAAENSAANSPRKTVTLVLGGGALKSVGEIGVLQVLEQEKIPIDYVYGTSCGSAIGSLYASGMPATEIAKLFVNGTWQRAAGNHFYLKAMCIPLTKIIPLSARNKWPGVLAGTHYLAFLKKRLPKTFDQLPIPFRAVAVDLCTGKPVVISKGDVSEAVLASSAMPPGIRPLEIGDMLLADGGLRRNVPTTCALDAKEGDIIIAVNSDGPIRQRPKRYFNSLQRINRRVADLMSYQSDERARESASIVITPDIDDLPVMTKNRKKIQAAIQAGRECALKDLPAIRKAMQ